MYIVLDSSRKIEICKTMEDGCKHLNNFKIAKGIQPYKTIFSFFIACTSSRAQKIKALHCYCHSCKKKEPRLHSCLHCIFFGCHSEGHIQDHAKTKKHFLVIELAYGNVFCFQCGDYVYDKELRAVAQKIQQQSAEHLGFWCTYKPWRPNLSEIQLLKANPRVRTIGKDSTIGIRGILNLGLTCFMNSVLQILTHTPVLRDYFLSDRQICQCQDKQNCMVCEMASLFQEFYSGDKSPLIPNRIMYLIWTQAKHLAGHRQQDAQECFIAILDLLHRNCQGFTSNQHCSCIIDQIFKGCLQSDIVCSVCRSKSTTIETFWDISLDLVDSVKGSLSLLECLQQFTQPETLGTGVPEMKVHCNTCDTNQVSTKQMTMKTLPVIICFHLKRFSQETSTSFHKLYTEVTFPQELDMSPFTSHQRNSNYPDKLYSATILDDCRYSLFAVIDQTGTFDGGHNIAFIRQQMQWFKCNDDVISQADIQQVLDSEGYLLFYHKNILEYE